MQLRGCPVIGEEEEPLDGSFSLVVSAFGVGHNKLMRHQQKTIRILFKLIPVIATLNE